MMKRSNQARLAAVAIVSGFALATTPTIHAQGESGIPSKPRTSDERVVTEQRTPPPVNSDYRKAAEGRLPGVGTTPGTAAGLVPAGGRQAAMDPAARALVGSRPGSMAAPAGLDVAMMIEHAVGMAIEGAALQSIAEQAGPDSNEPARMLLDHARRAMTESKAMLTAAAADGRGVDAASPTRRFYGAANDYLTTLARIGSKPSPADRAQIALINHAVKEVLDAGHIRQFGRAYSGSAATERLVGHAAAMSDEGMQTIARMASSGSPETTRLASQARDLVDAAQQLSALVVPMAGGPANSTGGVPIDPNPGRLQDTRPEIIGGTQATGSPTAGTTTPAAAVGNGNKTPAAGVNNNNLPPSNVSGSTRPR